MPPCDNPLDALVSVWTQAAPGSEKKPIGSGIFIASQYVLTAKHIVTDAQSHGGGVWLRNVKDNHDWVCVKDDRCNVHQKLDIALLKLDLPNDRQPWVGLDIRERDLKQQEVCLYGVLPQEKESTMVPDRTILARQDADGFYVTDYRHAAGYSGGVATIHNMIVGVISARYKEENLGIIIPISAAGDWLRSFKDLPESLLVRGPSPLDTSVSFPSQDAFARKVRSEIHTLLHRPHLQALHDAIAQQTGAASAADGLVPLQPAPLLEALDYLHHATKSCLQQLAEWDPDRIAPTKAAARDIFGWLVVLAVNREQVHAAGLAFDPWQGGLNVKIPLVSEAGIEVFVSSLGDRSAIFDLKYDNRNIPRVVGKGSFAADDLELGIGYSDQVTEILKRIWVVVTGFESPPHPFGEQEQKRLQAKLSARERRKESYNYITVSSGQSSSPLVDGALLTRLLQALPSLSIIYFGGAQGEEILLLDEYDLWESIEAFLLMLRDAP